MEEEENRCFSLVMAKNMYGRLLIRDPKRKEAGVLHLQQSESLARNMPHWWDHLDHIIVSDFDLK